MFVSVYFVMDSVRKLSDTPSYINTALCSGLETGLCAKGVNLGAQKLKLTMVDGDEL